MSNVITQRDEDGEETTLDVEAWENGPTKASTVTLTMEDPTQLIEIELSGKEVQTIIAKLQEMLALIEEEDKALRDHWNWISQA